MLCQVRPGEFSLPVYIWLGKVETEYVRLDYVRPGYVMFGQFRSG